MAVTDLVYDNWGNTTVIDRLYQEGVIVYELETSAGTIEIKEPVQWDKVEFVHKRDDKYHGFNYEFTGPDFDLLFNMYSGREAILAEYAQNGNDGLALFRRIISFGSVTITEYEGRLRLGDMKREVYHLSIPCERKSLHTLVNSRLSTKINIDKSVDLDDNTVPIYSRPLIILPGQNVSEKFKATKTKKEVATYTEARTGDDMALVFFTVADPVYNTMTGFNPSILGVSPEQANVSNDTHNLFEFKAAGEYDFTISVDFQVALRIHPRFLAFGKKVTKAWMVVQLNLIHKEGSVETITPFEIAHIAPFRPNLQGFQFPRITATKDFHIEVQDKDKLVLFAYIKYEHNANKLKSVDFTLTEYQTTVIVDGFSAAEQTFSSGVLIKAAMDAAMTRITGQIGLIESDFYSLADVDHAVDGCGANRVILNGGMLRFTNKFPLTFTWNDMLESMNAIDAIGMGYEWDAELERETIRIEPKEYFYQDVEVMHLNGVFDYQENVANELIFNKIVIGYEKYKEEEENSLDEIHAYHEYQTPIKTESNEYNIKSKFIGSGYLFEVTRRLALLSFDENPNVASSYDDDIFILHVWRDNPGLNLFGPVTIEPFTESIGLISPETTVNQMLAVKRMLMAHAKWLNSSLVYKGASELIKNTLTKQNKDYSSTLDPGYCKMGDLAGLPLKADDDILLDVFGDFTGIYSPEWVNLKVRLGMTQVRMIMNAHRGLDPDGKNYGYLSFLDDFGVACKGWLYSMSYNRMNQEVTMKLLKKKSL